MTGHIVEDEAGFLYRREAGEKVAPTSFSMF